MDRKARIIKFIPSALLPENDLEAVIAEWEDFDLDATEPFFGRMDLPKDGEGLILIQPGDYLIDGDEGCISVAVSIQPLSLLSLLENGIAPDSRKKLPIAWNVEILLTGDNGQIRIISDLPILGIHLIQPAGLQLDASWNKVGFRQSPHFQSEIWRRQKLVLETILKAERLTIPVRR